VDEANTWAGAVPVEGLTTDGISATPPVSSDASEAGRGVPRALRRSLSAVRVEVRRPTARFRALPDFLILGAQRSGTTSLYQYLAAHPAIAPPVRKEIQYLTLRHRRGIGWYRAHFPRARPGRVTFEATPYYLFHPLAPARAAAGLPDAKLIALLRNPVTRAFSHWQHNAQRGLDSLAFEDALDAETDRLAGEAERLVADPSSRSDAHRLWSYAARGRYADQLERWLACYPRDQLLILLSEDLYERPAATHARALEFLGLPTLTLASYPRYTRRTSDVTMAASTGRRLADHFRADNERLAGLIGRDPGWND